MREFWHGRADDEYPSGDPRRCPWHPHVTTSSPDGLFDGVCGECEAAMYADDGLCECGTVGCPGGAKCPGEVAPEPRPESDPVVLYRMGHPVRASAFDDDVPF